MKKVYVTFKDWETGVIQSIDQIEIEDGYTPEDYIRDCESNGIDMSDYEKESVDLYFEEME